MNWAQWIVTIFNFILVSFVFLQVRHTYKPQLSIKVIQRDKGVDERPEVLEYGELYSVISNVSTNSASGIRFKYEFVHNKEKLLVIRKNLEYLNPNEAIKEPLDVGKIISGYPELFLQHQRGNEIKTIPQETLNLELRISVDFKLGILPYRIRDSYKIEWGSLSSYPRYEDHPIFNCWNMRKGHYIYKIT